MAKNVHRCGTCGFRKPEIRSRCDHSRTVHMDGEPIGRISYRPDERDRDDGVQYRAWKVESYGPPAMWWRCDDYEDALYTLTATP